MVRYSRNVRETIYVLSFQPSQRGVEPADRCGVLLMEERESDSARICALNDQARSEPKSDYWVRWIVTLGVQALGADRIVEAVRAIQRFDAFDGDNDPQGEHDFGTFEIGGERLFWKIDSYDRQFSGGSPDPAGESVTCRVLTIMRALDY